MRGDDAADTIEKSISLVYIMFQSLKKIDNYMITPSGRKLCEGEREREKKCC